MHNRIYTLCIPLLMFPVVMTGIARAQNPDPVELLRNAVASRESIHSGYMELEYSKKPTKAKSEDGKLTFEFDGKKRTTTQGAMLSYANVGDEKKIKEAGSIEAAEKLGLVKKKYTRISYGWDGKKLANYWSDSVQATYRDPALQRSDYYFDPRVIGIDLNFMFSSTIEKCCGLDKPKSVDLVGEELVGERKAWRIKVINRFGSEYHFWVEEKAPFRVLRKKYTDNNSTEILESIYDFKSNSPLPKSTVKRSYRKNNEMTYEVTMKVTKAELNRPVSNHVGTLASLKVPAGTEIYDDVVDKRLGYWSGIDIVETKKQAEQENKETSPDKPKK